MYNPAIINAIKGSILLIVLVAIWDLYWRGKALWVSSKNSQKVWFVALLIINSVGILPIIYLLFFKPKTKTSKGKK